jgi:hypothetical protein
MSDDQQRRPDADDAEKAREKGADVEYDAEDEDALDRSAASAASEQTTRSERV